jgi:hypothetical protein
LTTIKDARTLGRRFGSGKEVVPMKRVSAVIVLALFGFAPVLGTACEYNKEASPALSSPEQLGMAPAPAVSKAPAPVVAGAPARKPAKQVPDKARNAPSGAALVAVRAD